MKLLASASSAESLLRLVGDEVPDSVLLYVDDCTARHKRGQISCQQVTQVKETWPDVFCLSLVKYAQLREEVRILGADAILVEGVTAAKLLEAIDPAYREETDNDV